MSPFQHLYGPGMYAVYPTADIAPPGPILVNAALRVAVVDVLAMRIVKSGRGAAEKPGTAVLK
jgi:hypothetical protein